MEITETESESVLGRKSGSLSVPKFNFVGLAAGLLFVSWYFLRDVGGGGNFIILVVVKWEFGNTYVHPSFREADLTLGALFSSLPGQCSRRRS